MFDIILQVESAFVFNFNFLSTSKLLRLLKDVKKRALLLKLVSERAEKLMIRAVIDNSFLKEIEMPAEVLKDVENWVLAEHKLRVRLPIDAEQIINLDIALLQNLIQHRCKAKISIKIFNAFVDIDAINRWDEGFWKHHKPQMLYHLLVKNPNAMTSRQFEALLQWSDEEFCYQCIEFMRSAI